MRLADRQLKPLAAHHFDQHGQLELPAPLDLVGVRALGVVDAQRHVAHELLVEPPLICLAVSLSPSLPASGDVLTPIVIDIAGSSTVITGSGRGSSRSASVSPIVTSRFRRPR